MKQCWVFDLDDTLYDEIDFQVSGMRQVLASVNDLHNVAKIESLPIEVLSSPNALDQIFKVCGVDDSLKTEMLWRYRLHLPDIELRSDAEDLLTKIRERGHSIAILTDGRSITQRNKLKALGLSKINAYISSEWGAPKPDLKRFKAIQQRFQAEQYIYVGDNPSKDFIAPKLLDWMTIGIRDNGKHIHKQMVKTNIADELLPHHWVDSMEKITSFIV